MRISIGAPSYRISESEYTASLHPSQSAADGTAPEEILKNIMFRICLSRTITG